MIESATETGQELIEKLVDGKMDSHPAVKFHIQKAIGTRDYAPLVEFVNRHPELLASAERNTALKEYQKVKNPFRPYPTRADAFKDLQGPLKFGYINEFDNMFGVDPDVFCTLTMIPGRSGSGKSQLNKYLLCQILRSPQSFNVIIPDIKPEYHYLLPYARHLKVLLPKHFKLNPLQVPEWTTTLEHAHFFSEVFVKENWLGGTSQNIIIQTITDLYRERGIFDRGKNFPSMKDLYAEISKRLSRQDSFKYRDILLWVQNRLYPYTQSATFDCSIGLPDSLWRTENLVIKLDAKFTENMYCFVVSLISGLTYNYNRQKGLVGSKLRTLFNVDEARILFNANRDVGSFGESYINEIITKTREFGIGFIISSQESSSFSQTVRSNSFLKVGFPLQDGKDKGFVRESFGLTEEQADYIFKLPKFGQAIVRYGGYPDAFLLQVPHFRIKKHITDEEIENRMADFYEDLERKMSAVPARRPLEIGSHIPPAATALLFFLGRNPFTKVSEMKETPGFRSHEEIERVLCWLEKNGFVTREKHRVSSRGKPATFGVLTEKGHAYLGTGGPKGKGSFEHSLYQHLIQKALKRENVEAKIEGQMRGGTKLIDVLAIQDGFVAYEITLHTGNLMSNIRQDLEDGVSRVVIVARDKTELQEVKKLAEAKPEFQQYADKVSFEAMDRFFLVKETPPPEDVDL